MAETTGIARFPGNLDPRAEEFRPRNPTTTSNQLVLFPPPPPQVYYPYATPYPPISEVQVMPFCDAGVGYHGQQFPAPPQPVAVRVGMMAPVPAPAPAGPTSSAAATRAVVLSSVPREASETTVRRELEVFGEVRGVQMERLASDGIVTVHFYDLRHAETALREIREQHMHHQTRLRNHYSTTTTTYSLLMMRNSPPGPTVDDLHNWAASAAAFLPPPPVPPPARGLICGLPVWAQFVIPPSNAVPDGHNQGTIVIFNLDPEVTAPTLKDIFQEFGAIKELRETPSKKHQKFVEFFDVRDAAKALKEMNGKEIHGKPVVIEFSRPGGHHSRKLINSAATSPHHHKYLSPPLQPPLPRKCSVRSSFNSNFTSIPPRSYASHAQFPVRKSSGNKVVSSSTSSSLSSVDRKMASVSLCNGNEDQRTKRFSKKNQSSTHASPSSPPPPTATQQQQTVSRNIKSRKGKHGKKFDSRFLISEEAMIESSCRDTRTTVMIKNIPNKYSQKLLLNMLDNHCINCNQQIADGGEDDHDQPFSSYDFVYLPIDFNNKCNVGYGFVNMTSPEATWRLYKAFHLQLWEAFNSRKICEVTYARVQGLEALKEHFKNSKFPCEMDHYLPVVFSPPRDGRQLTEPFPIVGQYKHHLGGVPLASSPMSTATSSDHHDDDDDDVDGGEGVEITDAYCHGSPDHEPGSGSPNGGAVSDDCDEGEEEDDDDDDYDHDEDRQIYVVVCQK